MALIAPNSYQNPFKRVPRPLLPNPASPEGLTMSTNIAYSARIAGTGDPEVQVAYQPTSYVLLRRGEGGTWAWFPTTQHNASYLVNFPDGESITVSQPSPETSKDLDTFHQSIQPTKAELEALLALVKRNHE